MLVLDPITTKVITNVAGISDIMEYGVSRAWRASERERAPLLAQHNALLGAASHAPHTHPPPPNTPLARTVVEDVTKRREPLPALVGVYFISPAEESVRQLIRDFSLAAMPQYRAAHVFFSSKLAPQQLAAIRDCPHLVSHLRTLKEVRRGSWERGTRRRAASPPFLTLRHSTHPSPPPRPGERRVPHGGPPHLFHARGGRAALLFWRVGGLVHRVPHAD